MKKNIQIAAPFIDEQELEAIKKSLLSGWLTQGPCVADFQKEFAKRHGVRYAVATSNCTTALHLALVALGIGPGDEVIIPSFTWISTANVVEYVGARPVFCDVNRDTYNMSVKSVETLINERTKAIIPVHLFGLCADMEPLLAVCRQHGLSVIEDAACAVGASIRGKMAGSFSDIGCFSFHPRKIVTTGEGGMCVTNHDALAKKLVALRNHGASVSEEKRFEGNRPYVMPEFDTLGYNYRMTDFQGALGKSQLSRLDFFIEERRKWADWYRKELKDLKWLITPVVAKGFGHSYQSFVCYIDEDKTPLSRDQILEKLHLNGVGARPGTIAIHMQNYYARKYNIKIDSLPISKDCALHSLAIPLHNRMSMDDYHYVVSILKGI